MATKVYYSQGKLLLTGEYVVLDGAKAFAIPTNKGQYLTVKTIADRKLVWKSFDENNQVWYEDEFSITQLETIDSENKITNTLLEILIAAQTLNPEFLNDDKGYYITTKLTFSREFGLGSSSTLIANIAKWAKVDPFELLWNSFKGSGYDLACATSTTGLVYQLEDSQPKFVKTVFNPSFKSQLYFVYLNQKQDSKEGILHYRKLSSVAKEKAIQAITAITASMLHCNTLVEFEELVNRHEAVMSELLALPTVKQRLFSEYSGGIKSLGAWGGDFVLVTVSDKSDLDYFKTKGYTTIFSFDEMLLA